MVSDILSDRSERMSAKKGSAAARFQPKLIAVSANGPQLAPSGRSNTAARLHAEPVPSSPPGSASNGTGGEAAPVLDLYRAWSAGFIFDVNVSHTPMRAHITMPYVSETHDCFHFWNVIPWSLHFLSVPDGKKTKQKKGQPPRHCGLKISPVTTLRATRSLRSLKQALRLTPPAKFSPFGHQPPFKGAGKLHQCWTYIVHEVRASFST